MKLKTLSNKIVSIELLQKKYPLRSEEDSKSKGQFRLGQLLCQLYGKEYIFEEFCIPEASLFIDFFIPKFSLAFEYDGLQHSKYTSFFHKTKLNFKKQLERDKQKQLWCSLNQILLVRIPDQELTLMKLKNYVTKCQKQEILKQKLSS